MGPWIGWLGAALGVIVVTSAAVAVARANFAKAQIEALRGDVKDLESRVSRLKEENTTLSGKLETEVKKVEILQGVVSGKEELKSINEKMANLEGNIVSIGKKLEEKHTALITRVGKVERLLEAHHAN